MSTKPIDRLIRSLVEDRKAEILEEYKRDREAGRSAVTIRIGDCSPDVQKAIKLLRLHEPFVERAKATLKKHGVEPPSRCVCPGDDDDAGPMRLKLTYDKKQAAEQVHNDRRDARCAAVARLGHKAEAAALRASTGDRKAQIVEILSRDLDAV